MNNTTPRVSKHPRNGSVPWIRPSPVRSTGIRCRTTKGPLGSCVTCWARPPAWSLSASDTHLKRTAGAPCQRGVRKHRPKATGRERHAIG
eukprot:8053827-Pyramimonas_sp.AAC.1